MTKWLIPLLSFSLTERYLGMFKDFKPEKEKEIRRLAKEKGWTYKEAFDFLRGNPDTDPIAVTHEQDPSLDEDEMILHTTIDPDSIKNKENNE